VVVVQLDRVFDELGEIKSLLLLGAQGQVLQDRTHSSNGIVQLVMTTELVLSKATSRARMSYFIEVIHEGSQQYVKGHHQCIFLMISVTLINHQTHPGTQSLGTHKPAGLPQHRQILLSKQHHQHQLPMAASARSNAATCLHTLTHNLIYNAAHHSSPICDGAGVCHQWNSLLP
jgi:hypothetical protein